MTTFYLPYVLMIPADHSSVNGFGATVTGYQSPQLDTLIGIFNPSLSTQVVRFRFFNQNGTPVLWGDALAYRDYSLSAGHCVATTFITNNIFADPPQNFRGYGTITANIDMPVYTLIGGGNDFPMQWNIVSAAMPTYRDLGSADTWRFAYLIPYFQDANHSDTYSYRTELIITNFSGTSSAFWITFTVGDIYPTVGTQYVAKVTIPAGESRNYDMYTLLQTVGYSATLNAEGSLVVEARTSETAGAPLQSIQACPVLIHWSRDKTLFSAGEGFWQ